MSRVHGPGTKIAHGFAAFFAATATLLMGGTFLPVFIPCILLTAAMLASSIRAKMGPIVCVFLCVSGLRFYQSPEMMTGVVLPAAVGQYSARSTDLLGLISARAVIREGKQGNVLVFVEANTLPFSGLDAETLNREIHRVLEAQGIPPAPSKQSDETTAVLFYTALSQALAPHRSPEPVECPKGISAPETFWKMYPAEFSHQCEVGPLPNGRYWGQSTADIPVTARLDIKNGRIEEIHFQGPLSPYGQRAAEQMKQRMLAANDLSVDIVSGATQTAYAVRSAANSACTNAHLQAAAHSELTSR